MHNERWQKESTELGFTKESLERLTSKKKGKAKVLSPRTVRTIAKDSLFEKTHLHKVIATRLIGEGSYRDIKQGIKVAQSLPELEQMKPDSFRQKYATKEMLAIEKRIYQTIRDRAEEAQLLFQSETF